MVNTARAQTKTTAIPCLCMQNECQAGKELCHPGRERSREYKGMDLFMLEWTRGEMICMDSKDIHLLLPLQYIILLILGVCLYWHNI